MSQSNKTTDHQKIKEWAESRHGVPTKIKGTGEDKREGILRIHFPEQSQGNDFEKISWDDFFKNFDESNLLFLYQDKKENGELSTFHKFVNNDN